MVGSNPVHCSKCGKAIFYLLKSYKMSCKVLCIECGNKSTKRVGKAIKRTAAANYANVKRGVRKDIHPTYYFRSATEANFARILQYHGFKWKFEEKTFKFTGYKTKPYMYLMDFEITSKPHKKKKDLYKGLEKGFYEIKGHMNPRSRNKLRRLRKQHPGDSDRTCVVVYTKNNKKDIEFCEKQKFRVLHYDLLTKHYKDLIDTWE